MLLENTIGHEQTGTLLYSVAPLCMFLMESPRVVLFFSLSHRESEEVNLSGGEKGGHMVVKTTSQPQPIEEES